MTIEEVAKVLAKIQLVDNREISKLVVLEWFDLIGHLDFDAAIEAVRVHRQTSTEYLQPAHIVDLAGVPEFPYESIDDELLLESKRATLALHGTTPDEFDTDPRVRARVIAAIKRAELES